MFGVLGALGLIAAASAACPGDTTGGGMFPPAAFSTNGVTDDLARRWFGRHLRAFAQPSLACAPDEPGTTYRLLWLPSTTRMRAPGVRSIMIVLTRVSAETRLVAKTRAGARRGAAETSSSRTLTAAEWQRVESLLDRADFWNVERMGPASIDGDAWVIEGRRPGRYQVVVRFAGRRGALGEAGLTFLKLSGLTLPD